MNRAHQLNTFALASLALVGLLLLAMLPAQGEGASTVIKVSVPANTKLLATSVTLATGQSASVAATGTISYGSGWPACQGIPITPDGCAAEPAAPVLGAAGALVAKVGAGAPFVIGRTGTVTGPGTISLGINDWESELGNNTGSFDVTITTGATPSSPGLPPSTDAIARPVSALSLKTNKANYGGVTITRGGKRYRMTADSTLQAGDVISTNGTTILTIEFGIGGRAGLGRNSSVRLVDDRQLEGVNGTTTVSTSNLRQPIEIQTNGGTMGIRG